MLNLQVPYFSGGSLTQFCQSLKLMIDIGSWFPVQEYKAGPLAEYDRRIAAGELKPGDEFQVLGEQIYCLATRSVTFRAYVFLSFYYTSLS